MKYISILLLVLVFSCRKSPVLSNRQQNNLTIDSKDVCISTVHGYAILRDTSITKKEPGILAVHNQSVYYYNGNSWFILFEN